VPGDVADGEADQPAAELDHVVPVAADSHVGGRRDVPGGHGDAGDVRDAVREQAALQRLGDLVLSPGSCLLQAQLLLCLGPLVDLLKQTGVGFRKLRRATLDAPLQLGRRGRQGPSRLHALGHERREEERRERDAGVERLEGEHLLQQRPTLEPAELVGRRPCCDQ
jgi:hypothetical protein